MLRGPGDRHRDPEEDGDDDERHPIGREDAQEAVARVRADVAGALPGERGGDHRPVQQETGDQEEHLHAGVHPREVVANHPRVMRERHPHPAELERGRERGVVEHDHERRDRTQPVEAREATLEVRLLLVHQVCFTSGRNHCRNGRSRRRFIGRSSQYHDTVAVKTLIATAMLVITTKFACSGTLLVHCIALSVQP